MRPSFELHTGYCVDVMASLPAESVDAIVTSPPYAMQRKTTYGGIPEADYPAWTVAWMTEARRILKPDGSVLINIRPHIRKGQISDYTLRTRLALREAGWAECEELIWHKPNAMPSGSPYRPRRSWESIHWFAKHGSPWSDVKANGREATRPIGVHYGQAGRNGWDHYNNGSSSTPERTKSPDIFSAASGNETTGHPAPFPTAVAEWMGRLVCPYGGTILDPFSGSGSTGVAASRNGWHYIGIDSVAEYTDLAHARLGNELPAAA